MSEQLSEDARLIVVEDRCVYGTTEKQDRRFTNPGFHNGSYDPSDLQRPPEFLIDESFRIHKVIYLRHRCPSTSGWINWLKRKLFFRVERIFDGPPRQSTLDECRELIYRTMEQNPELWEASRPLESWKENLWAITSFEELWSLLNG